MKRPGYAVAYASDRNKTNVLSDMSDKVTETRAPMCVQRCRGKPDGEYSVIFRFLRKHPYPAAPPPVPRDKRLLVCKHMFATFERKTFQPPQAAEPLNPSAAAGGGTLEPPNGLFIPASPDILGA